MQSFFKTKKINRKEVAIRNNEIACPQVTIIEEQTLPWLCLKNFKVATAFLIYGGL